MDIEEVRREIRRKKKKTNSNNILTKFFIKLFITIIITLITLIVLKKYEKLQSKFYKYVYEDTFKFAVVNKLYNKYLGSVVPPFITKPSEKKVFNEKLEYNKINKYNDGCKLDVTANYLVPSLNSGMVVFIGEKELYGNVVIVQQVDGVDVWYGNINTSSVKIYDYIEKGSLIGEVKDSNLYLLFKKDGNSLNYEDYL